MNKRTAEILCSLTSDFYRRQAASFSQTRNHPWPGWRRCVDALLETHEAEGLSEATGAEGGGGAACVRVLDVACGNLRFERFLLQEFPQVAWNMRAVDNCDALACGLPESAAVDYLHADVLGELLDGWPLRCVQDDGLFDAAVAFGFMHHVPGVERRADFLRALVSRVRPGGLAAVSFWRFMSDASLAEKSLEAHRRAMARLAAADGPWVGGHVAAGGRTPAPESTRFGALDASQLEENDYLLGWKDEQTAVRYCHHFPEAEIDALEEAARDIAQPVARFCADGRTNALNAYLVLRRR